MNLNFVCLYNIFRNCFYNLLIVNHILFKDVRKVFPITDSLKSTEFIKSAYTLVKIKKRIYDLKKMVD